MPEWRFGIVGNPKVVEFRGVKEHILSVLGRAKIPRLRLVFSSLFGVTFWKVVKELYENEF